MSNFSPNRMSIARKRRGMTLKELAEKCGVSTTFVSLLEAGKENLPEDFLSKLVFVVGFPPKFFFGDEIDPIPEEAFSFRSLRSKMKRRTRDVAVALGHLAFGWVSRDLNRRYNLPMVQVPDLREYSPEDAADTLRVMWNLGYEPIFNMVHLLESRGVEIYWVAEDAPALDAFSLWRDGKPYVALNSNKDAGDRSRMDAAHELGHLVLHRWADDLTTGEREDEAYRFASAFLLPAAQFMTECPDRPEPNLLYRLKGRWGVSIQAMIMRGHQLGLFSDWQKKNAFQTLTIIGERKHERVHIDPEHSVLHKIVFESLKNKGIDAKKYAMQELGIDFQTLTELMPVAREYSDEAKPKQVDSTSTNQRHMRVI